MTLAMHTLRLVTRRPRRSLASGLGVAIAAALLMSIVLFAMASGSTVTRRALAGVPVDAQVVMSPGADPAAAQAVVDTDPVVAAVMPLDVVHFDTAVLNRAGAATQTSVGLILGLDPSYTPTTGLFPVSLGAQAPGQALISRDLASNLGARPGDVVQFQLPGGSSVDLVVSGIVDLTGADQVLGPIDAAHRAAGFNPPTNVAVMDRASLLSGVESLVPAGTQASADPGAVTANAPGTSPVTASEAAVLRELHLRYDHAQLPGDPAAAQAWLDQVRRRIEIAGAGSFVVVDNAADALSPIISDLAWGQILFVFLGLPGVALALILARLVSASTSDGMRRHVTLLRARGASSRELRGVLVGSELLVALLGALVGALLGTVIAVALFGSELASADAAGSVLRAVLLVVPLTALLAVLAATTSMHRLLAETVAAGRQELQRRRAPLWKRLYLDVVAIVAALVTFYLVDGGGVHPVVNAEGNPTASLALTSFVAPFLLWLGFSLLLLRLADVALRRSDRLAAVLGRLLGPGGALAARTLAARAAGASRLLVLIALAVSFAVSVSMFDATYRQQQRVDAQLTLGADLKATPSTPTDQSALGLVAGPGIAAVTPFDHRVVYVGAEAQDLLAIDPRSLPAVAPVADAFFDGSTASQAMAALAAAPNGILVSSETAKDYSIVPGDTLRIRVPDATGALREVQFQMVGIALEFPTAPRDAFLVANAAYVAQQTGDPQISFVLARTTGDTGAAVAARLGPAWTVQDLASVTARLANGITSVDLQALVLIDIAFAMLIASLGAALFVLNGVAERSRELAALQAVGAEPAQLRALLGGEVAAVGTAGLAAGLLAGALVGFALLTILAGIFDPPAALPAVPWLTVSLIGLSLIVGLVVAFLVASHHAARMSTLQLLRDR